MGGPRGDVQSVRWLWRGHGQRTTSYLPCVRRVGKEGKLVNKIRIILGAAALALVLAGCFFTPGGSCDQLGSKHSSKGQTYTCSKVGEKRIWVQDAPLTPDRP